MKEIIVQKYGGACLASIDDIKRVAKRVIETKQQGYNLLVVVSAMGDTTDHLLEQANQITLDPKRRELDMLLTAGERISMALLSMAINAHHIPALSLTGSQGGIITNSNHTEADIIDIRGERIKESLLEEKVVIIAGFQGVSFEKEITTLGRGGSDTTAVALAAHFKAKRCELFKDVNGIYTEDPKKNLQAKKLQYVSYDDALAIIRRGSVVLHEKSIELAKKFGVVLHVRSGFTNEDGTVIGMNN